MILHRALLFGENLLRENRVSEPRWNAERILLLSVNQERGKIYSDLNRELTPLELQTFETLLHKRAEHFPLAYLEGTQEFYGRRFFVDPGVLIPRPETEEIVRGVLELDLPESPRILDLGSGSGCIAVTLAIELQPASVFAIDISAEALRVLRQNVAGRVKVVRADLFAIPFVSDFFDLVVANPPYVDASSFRALPAETKWEPYIALATSSLEETYRGLIRQSMRVLKSGGFLVFEIGYGQAHLIREITADEREVRLVQVRDDRQSIPRTFVVQKERVKPQMNTEEHGC